MARFEFPRNHPFWAYLLGIHLIFSEHMGPRQWFHGSWLPSKHRTHLQDQPMFSRWLPKLSTGPATGRLPYQKEMALLRWAEIFFRCIHGFLKNIFLAKKGKIFCGVLFFLGGELKWLDVTLLRFFGWHDTYSWVLEVCFGAHQYALETSLVPKRTSDEPTYLEDHPS